jgi:hypothetical protein
MKKMVFIIGLIIFTAFLMNGCINKTGTIEDLNVEKTINDKFKDASSTWQLRKILYKQGINDNETIVFYLSKRGLINIARIARIDDEWEVKVATPGEVEKGDAISWSWSLLCNPPVEENYEVGAVFYGYINNPAVAKVIVSSKDGEFYKEAETKDFYVNDKKIKLYYLFSENTSGFETNVTAFDQDGNILYKNWQ